MTGPQRETPPPITRGRHSYDWAEIAATLTADPGEWYKIVTCSTAANSSTTARYVRRSFYKPLRDGRYEAVARFIDGEHRVYARYLGPA
jgi:hypothetical protein